DADEEGPDATRRQFGPAARGGGDRAGESRYAVVRRGGGVMETTHKGVALSIVQMVGPFTFKGRLYPPGRLLMLWPSRRALTHAEYLAEFTKPPAPEW